MPCLLPLLASPGTSAFLKTFPECPQLCQTHPTSAHKWSFLFLHSGSPFCPCHQESHRGPQLMMTRPPGSSSAPAKGAASCRICGSPPAFILSERGRYRILLRLVPLSPGRQSALLWPLPLSSTCSLEQPLGLCLPLMLRESR